MCGSDMPARGEASCLAPAGGRWLGGLFRVGDPSLALSVSSFASGVIHEWPGWTCEIQLVTLDRCATIHDFSE